MTIVYLLIAVLGCLIVLRSALLLVFAEIGRKQDLIKHIYKSGTDFQIAVVIPFLDSRKVTPLQDLLQALLKQDYPLSRLGIHVVATEDSVFALPGQDDLPTNIKVWTYPSKHASQGQSVSWLIERLLAAGGPSKLFVFLDADDIVRPDFLRNVTTRAFDCYAMQGYIALKRPPKGLLSSIAALSVRLINRIENAGRFHMGLSCKLLSSGWVVRQEILEMLPFKQGNDIECLEYATLLNLHGYRVNWAPNVVVYKEEKADLSSLFKGIAHSAINRIRLTLQYSIQLLVQSFTRLDFNLLDQAWCLIKPPNFVIGLIALAGTLYMLQNPAYPGNFYYWSIFLLGFWTTQLISVAVARCSFKDVLSFIFITPIVYLAGLMMFPLFLITSIGEAVFQFNTRPKKMRVGKRFDESQPARSAKEVERMMARDKRLIPSLSKEDLYDDEDLDGYTYTSMQTEAADFGASPTSQKGFASLYEEKMTWQEHTPDFEAANDSKQASEPREYTMNLPISNGTHSVDCTLRVIKNWDTTNQETFHLVFQYKNLSFTTQTYRILDQAYYELLTKLKSKGFTVVSCGSCAYFYRPTAGNAFAKDFGFCLYGKQGKEVNLETDAVTVVSQSCQQYTDMAQREAVVKQWSDSIQRVSVS